MHTIHIPNWHPVTINKLLSTHKVSYRNKLKKRDYSVIATHTRMYEIPEAETKRRVYLKIGLSRKQKACDVDAYFKSLLDCLVNAKMLINDSYKWVEITNPEFIRGDKKYTTILLEDISS